MKHILFLAVIIAAGLYWSCSNGTYKDRSLSPELRAEDLVKRLTLEEKVSLIKNSSKPVPRLGIKEYDWWNEALHGVARNGIATVYPQAIGMAASFNDSLLYEVFTSVSDEARVKYRIAMNKGRIERFQGLTMWTPNINIFRDPRWGRGQETYGEDPYLTSIMGVSVIKGLQGETIDGVDKLHACAKHFAVHNGPEWNRHSFNAKNIAPRDLWETYLPAFEAAVKKGDVKEIMCAYNRFEGEPCCGNEQLLTQILRGQWGFDGIVLSDCGAIRNFYMKDRHETHPDSKTASADAIISGTDLNCGSTYSAVKESVEASLLSEEQLDIAVKRVLKARYELGEMDGSSPWDNLPDSTINCSKHRDQALQMARETMVLLKNDGILPLNNPQKIVLLGQNADDEKMQWGNYHGEAKETVTLYKALRLALPNTEIVYDKVSSLTGDTESLIDECAYEGRKGIFATYWNNTEMIGEPAATVQYDNKIKIGKRDTAAPGLDLTDISAKYITELKSKESGDIEFVFVTNSKLKLKVNGQMVVLKKKLPAVQYAKYRVSSKKQYIIEVEQIHEEQGQFKFDIIRYLKTDLNKVIKLAENADLVIYAGGLNASLEREESNIYAPGFMGGDRTDIELPLAQREVINALKKNGSKIILVNFSGSAIGLVPESKNCSAILQAWYPGEAGGTAIVDVLLGKYNPAGRLPVTFYKSVNQLPDFEDYSMQNRTYRYLKEEPLYPFGYGLSYTTFSYGNVQLDKTIINPGKKVTLSAQVTNSGAMDGDEVVQVYIKKVGDIEGPQKALMAFKRVSIPAGETIDVSFELNQDNLIWWSEEAGMMGILPGEYEIGIGGSSMNKDLQTISLQIEN